MFYERRPVAPQQKAFVQRASQKKPDSLGAPPVIVKEALKVQERKFKEQIDAKERVIR
jgi:hypothetical protein